MHAFQERLRQRQPFRGTLRLNPRGRSGAGRVEGVGDHLPELLRMYGGGVQSESKIYVDDGVFRSRSWLQACVATAVVESEARDLGIALDGRKFVAPTQDAPIVGIGTDTREGVGAGAQ